jgi:hypothetical protein
MEEVWLLVAFRKWDLCDGYMFCVLLGGVSTIKVK